MDMIQTDRLKLGFEIVWIRPIEKLDYLQSLKEKFSIMFCPHSEGNLVK